MADNHILPFCQNGQHIEITYSNTTTQATITNASYTDITVPASALTMMMRSTAAWSFSFASNEAGTTDFYVKADEVVTLNFGSISAKHIYVKGAGAGQKLAIMYGLSRSIE